MLNRGLPTTARADGPDTEPPAAARGLIAAIADGDIQPGEPTVLINGGGLPSVFAHDPDDLIVAS